MTHASEQQWEGLERRLAIQREVLLNLCDRVERLEMRADGLTAMERVERRWAKEKAGGDKLDRLIAQDREADGPAVPDGREPAVVVGEPSDEELLYIAAQAIEPYDTIRLGEYEAGNGCAMEVYGNELIAFARAVLARYSRQPAPRAEGEVGELADRLGRIADGVRDMGWERDAGTISRAAKLLQQRHPEPVPVRERLPGPEDCTTNPRNGRGQWCWGWVQHDQPPYSGRWRMMLREWLSDEAVAWLPATALPLPQQETSND